MSTPAHAVTPVACTEGALRAAIANSNLVVGGDTLSLIPYCLYTLTDAGGGALPQLSQPLVILGNNATIKRDTSSSDFRIFDVGTGASLTADTLTIMNGHADATGGGGVLVNSGAGPLTATNVNFQGNASDQDGGGVRVAAGALGTSTISGGVVSDNRATLDGGGIDAEGAVNIAGTTVSRNRATRFGGGINNDVGAGMLNVSDAVVRNNSGVTGGMDLDANAFITRTTMTDNTSRGGTGGGAIYSGGFLVIQNSVISGNTNTASTASQAGGIEADGTSVVITSTRITNNRAIGANASGAGIYLNSGSLTLDGVTLTGNLASGQYAVGGGIYAGGAGMTIQNNTLVDNNKVTGTGSYAAGIYNTGTSVSLTGSHVDNNTAPPAPAPGGIWTDIQFTSVTGSTITGNTPTNCLLSPVIPTGCIG
ncbi:right-handed parallel beta-helix repeat-containing protein [Streptomyces sp. NPDC086787]|uniref:right-handed parallel beta-helix repeat-containing protein n=1 Tax=Streptomyces sp. NPDC086787 TaxID=3365759 RepID=UPI0037F22ACD